MILSLIEIYRGNGFFIHSNSTDFRCKFFSSKGAKPFVFYTVVESGSGLAQTLSWVTGNVGDAKIAGSPERNSQGGSIMANAETKTEGAYKAGDGAYVFDVDKLQGLDAGPG